MANESSTITSAVNLMEYGVRRGDLLESATSRERITRITPTVLTVRPLHRWRAVAWPRCQWERFVQWPVRDAIEYVRRIVVMKHD